MLRIAGAGLGAAVSLVGLLGQPKTALAQPQGSEAEGQRVDGLELSLRTGYAVGRGPITERASVGDRLSLAVPLWLDLGYRKDRWLIGGYAQAALAVGSKTSEARCEDCSTSWLRLGLQVQYDVYETESQTLWLSISAGREWLNTTLDADRRYTEATSGWEFLGLGLGSNLQLAEGVTLGPFTTISFGQYDVSVRKCAEERLCAKDEVRVETQLSGLGVHTWFITGLRVSVLP